MFSVPLRSTRSVLIVLTLLGAAVLPGATLAQGFDSGCTDELLRKGENSEGVFDETYFTVRGVDEEAFFYVNADGAETAGKHVFAEEYLVSDPGIGLNRMEVRDAKGAQQRLGWVEKNSVLCRNDPLRDPETGLWRRVFIQTATRSLGEAADDNAQAGDIEAKPLHRGPRMECDETCRKVGRFEWFYVYGDSDGRLLISKGIDLRTRDTDVQLAGWLKAEDGIPWNTASALRPAIAEEVAPADLPEILCAYASPEEAAARQNCREFLTGPLWFEIDLRLPVLDETDDTWKVIFKGGGGKQDRDELLAMLNNDRRRSNIANGLNNLDVLFLIDGTKSIEPAIAAIKGSNGQPGIVERLKDGLQDKIAEGGQFRVGYRVYRDSAKGSRNDGVQESENRALDALGCNDDSASFADDFRKVTAQDLVKDDDFSENLMGGLKQALRDISGCRNHAKMIIVVGDHGYDAGKQRQRGHRSVSHEDISSAMKSTTAFETAPLIFFLQLPKANLSTIINDEGYVKAYEDFARIARRTIRDTAAIYGARLSGPQQSEMVREMSSDMFRVLPSNGISDAVVDGIVETAAAYLNPVVSDSIGQGGESIQDSIKRLQKRSGGVPLLWWGMAEQRFCEGLPDQCSETVLEKVDTLYVRKADAHLLVPEIIMTREQLENWIELLRGFRYFRGKEIVNGLRNTLEEVVGSQFSITVGNPRRESDGEPMTLGEILQLKGGLPSGTQSDFLAYTPQHFQPGGMQQCEVFALSEYVSRREPVLTELAEGTKLPMYDVYPPNVQTCPQLSEVGRELGIINNETRRNIDLSDQEEGIDRGYKHPMGGTQIYWIPLRYIP